MATVCDKEAVRQAYDQVRDDKTETNWAVFKYEGNTITVANTGVDYDEFLNSFNGEHFFFHLKTSWFKSWTFVNFIFKEGERLYAFVRLFTGDELSKRAKFAFVTWIGGSVGALKRAKVSIDKTLVKEVVTVSKHINKTFIFKNKINRLIQKI